MTKALLGQFGAGEHARFAAGDPLAGLVDRVAGY
jgi:hypothetical protein